MPAPLYAFEYQTLDAEKRALDMDPLDTSYDADIELRLSAAGLAINEHCNRHFELITETRTFDAPASVRLDIPDLNATPIPVIMQTTATPQLLAPGVDYDFEPHTLTTLHPAYVAVIRKAGGFAKRWGYKPRSADLVSVTVGRWGEYDYYPALDAPYGPYAPYAPVQSYSQITINGAWGYQINGAVPSAVVIACELIATRLWSARQVHYAEAGGGSPQQGIKSTARTMIDSDEMLQLLLQPLVRQVSTEEGVD